MGRGWSRRRPVWKSGADAIRDLQPSLVILDKSFGTSTVADWVRLLSTGETLRR